MGRKVSKGSKLAGTFGRTKSCARYHECGSLWYDKSTSKIHFGAGIDKIVQQFSAGETTFVPFRLRRPQSQTMRAVVQKVQNAAVTSVIGDGKSVETAEIQRGLCVLVGFEHNDSPADCQSIATALFKLRLFEDLNSAADTGRQTRQMKTVNDLGLDILLVSQFTLSATLKSGRPSFHRAMAPDPARELYDEFVRICGTLQQGGGKVGNGVFGSMMQVHLVGDGPMTICLSCKDGGPCSTW